MAFPVPSPEDDPDRVELIVMISEVVQALQNGQEGRDTVICLRKVIQKLDILLEKGSW